MSAYETIVEETIVNRVKAAFSSEQKNGKMSNETLFILQTRLFDYPESGKTVNNSNFFPQAIRILLDKQIEKAQDQIVEIHPPEFYAKNRLDSINPEIKGKLLVEIKAIFLDQNDQVKQCYIDAFGGEAKIQEIFHTFAFNCVNYEKIIDEEINDEEINDKKVEATEDPMNKFKNVLINAYYDHCKQEVGLQAANICVADGSVFHIAKLLAAGGIPADILSDMYPDAYQQYLEIANLLAKERALATAPEMEPLTDLLADDDISPTPSATPDTQEDEDINSLMSQSDAIHGNVVAQQPHYYSSADHASFFNGSRQCSKPLAKEGLRLVKPLSPSAPEEGCRIS